MFRNSSCPQAGEPATSPPPLTAAQLKFARVLGALLAQAWTENQERAPLQAQSTSPTLVERQKKPHRPKNS